MVLIEDCIMNIVMLSYPGDLPAWKFFAIVINSVSDTGSIKIESKNSPERYDWGEILVLQMFLPRFGPILLK